MKRRKDIEATVDRWTEMARYGELADEELTQLWIMKQLLVLTKDFVEEPEPETTTREMPQWLSEMMAARDIADWDERQGRWAITNRFGDRWFPDHPENMGRNERVPGGQGRLAQPRAVNRPVFNWQAFDPVDVPVWRRNLAGAGVEVVDEATPEPQLVFDAMERLENERG